MDYSHIPQHIGNDALFEHFNLTQNERYSLPRWRKDQNMLGYVVLLKTYSFLGFPPRERGDVPQAVVSWISQQLDVDPADFLSSDTRHVMQEIGRTVLQFRIRVLNDEF